jgi:alpha-tubulin suppressor-like RCC1 family protein
VQCFGNGRDGQLANGGTSDSNYPADVTGYAYSGAVNVGLGGFHTCLIDDVDNGAVFCAGLNYIGQLGDGTNTDRLTMTQVSGLDTSYLSVDGGYVHTCALSNWGGIKW